MNENEEMIEIPLNEYLDLKERDAWLSCLESAGVDNWDGIDYAKELADMEGGGC